MSRPRKLKSVEWRAPDGQRLYPPASCFVPSSPFAPVLSPQWGDAGEIETVEHYEERVIAFLKRRERGFIRSLKTKRKRATRTKRPHEQIECELKNLRDRKYQARQAPEQRQREKEQRRARWKPKPFMAIDGEGGGTDEFGRQNYNLMIALSTEQVSELSKSQLNKERLTTIDCFEFILSLPNTHTLIAFVLGYDATQILRDIPPAVLKRIYDPYHYKSGAISPEYWKDYAIIYISGKKLSIGRVDRAQPIRKGKRPPVVKGSWRTIYDTYQNFQTSFAKAIEHWKTGTEEERRLIALTKDERNEFEGLTPEIIAYCKLECRHLLEMMTKYREQCYDLEIRPRYWNGAGEVAAVLLNDHGVPKRPRTQRELQWLADRKPAKTPKPDIRRPARTPECERFVSGAFYGGRFETSCIGNLPYTMHQYDLNSAYPAAMLQLPCPMHTRWARSRRKGLPAKGALYCAKITFDHPKNTRWCGFPFRTKSGTIIYPMRGTGTYFSPEIEAALRHLGARIVKVHELWIAECDCGCPPLMAWVADLFEERNRLGKNGRGYPIKIGLNALYGKFAQWRVGIGPFQDAVAAGLITAITRARLLEPVGQDPEAIKALATDAVFSSRPLALDIGKGLGQWDHATYDDLFIVQSGTYFSPSKLREAADSSDVVKSRGVNRTVVGRAAPLIMRTFDELFDLMRDPVKREILLTERKFHEVPLTVNVFYGHKLALARHKPILAGKWEEVSRVETFEWSTKRDPFKIVINDAGYIETFPIAGRLTVESKGYAPADFDKLKLYRGREGEEFQEDEDTLLEGMPDKVDYLPHGD